MSIKEEECIELKNIKYKTMLMSGNAIKETKTSNDMSKLDKFLEQDKTNNENESWTKLDKTVKTRKLIVFVEKYKTENELTDEEGQMLIAFLKDCLDKKKIQRIKDVIYDKETGAIKEIPALFFNKPTKHFTLKHTDKRVSTLKSLPQKKIRTTAKNIIQKDSDDEKDAEL
jgi:hypothetical protein